MPKKTSPFAGLAPRKQRRAEARKARTPFEPQYNGPPPKRRTDYARFDGKYVTVSDKVRGGGD
ncbi:hypothetical protein [Salibacterium lacus]|uniref:30S ribosomal protein S18 n=1 Tax=Salibacterium lacus TaxID=1898109 RepID=A0ABW5T1B9_9BACI